MIFRIGKRLAFANSGVHFLAPTIIIYFSFFFLPWEVLAWGEVMVVSMLVLWLYNRIQIHRVRRRVSYKLFIEEKLCFWSTFKSTHWKGLAVRQLMLMRVHYFRVAYHFAASAWFLVKWAVNSMIMTSPTSFNSVWLWLIIFRIKYASFYYFEF